MSETARTVVVGGGIAGLRAAMDLADLGQEVLLLERTVQVGGALLDLERWFPDNSCGLCRSLDADVGRVETVQCLREGLCHPRITIWTESEVIGAEEKDEGLVLVVAHHSEEEAGRTEEVLADRVIVASGFREIQPAYLEEYGYKKFANVLTATELELMLARPAARPLARPSDGKPVQRVAFVACIGSRDQTHPYCSSACCAYLAKDASHLLEIVPEAGVSFHCMDLRLHGKEHDLYREKALGKVDLQRGRPASVQPCEDGSLKLTAEDDEGRLRSWEVDLVVLGAGQEAGAPDLLRALQVEVDSDGYPLPADALWPIRTNQPKVLTIGASRAPMDIPRSVMDARAAVALLAQEESLDPPEQPAARTLVVGGGPAGLSAALSLASLGYQTVLAEEEPHLGGLGLQAQSAHIFEADPVAALGELIKEVEEHPAIEVRTGTTVAGVRGYPGAFTASLVSGSNGEQKRTHESFAAVIAATGAPQHQPEAAGEKVITLRQMEELLEAGQDLPQEVVFVQCVDSRNDERPYCSRICCPTAIRLARELRQARPEAQVHILHRDVMTPGLLERVYTAARQEGVLFARFDKEKPPVIEEGEKGPVLRLYDHLLHRDLEFHPDLVVLSTGFAPPAGRLNALEVPVGADHFGQDNEAKFRPNRTQRPGFYMAGTTRAPGFMPEACLEGAASAVGVTMLLQRLLQPETERVTSRTRERICAACGACVEICPVQARFLHGTPTAARVLDALCQVCGACVTVCPSGAAEIPEEEVDLDSEVAKIIFTGGAA